MVCDAITLSSLSGVVALASIVKYCFGYLKSKLKKYSSFAHELK